MTIELEYVKSGTPSEVMKRLDIVSCSPNGRKIIEDAKQWLQQLCNEVDFVQKTNETLNRVFMESTDDRLVFVQALKFYADGKTYHDRHPETGEYLIELDMGQKASEALENCIELDTVEDVCDYAQDNAIKWAKAFRKLAKKKYNIALEQEWIFSFFSYAIEHSYTVRQQKENKDKQPGDSPKDGHWGDFVD